MKKVLLVIAALLLAPLAVNAAEYKEGVNYTVINNGPGTSKPEITEYFSFFCPHCYHFSKDILPSMIKGLPKGVSFNQNHVEFIGREMGVEMSRAFAVAEQLNVTDKIEKALFTAIHEKKEHFVNRNDIRKVFVANGVDGKDFDAAADSFMVSAQMSKMKQDTVNAKIDGVPAFVVNGKYRIENSSIKSYEELVKIAYYLAQKK